MLYARCAHCGYIAPLTCSGRFMPHQTMLVSLTGMGPTCPACGPLPPVFTCPYGFTQYLYLPGTPMPQGGGYSYAPVVQAQPGASPKTLKEMFADVVGKAAASAGEEAVDQVFGRFE